LPLLFRLSSPQRIYRCPAPFISKDEPLHQQAGCPHLDSEIGTSSKARPLSPTSHKAVAVASRVARGLQPHVQPSHKFGCTIFATVSSSIRWAIAPGAHISILRDRYLVESTTALPTSHKAVAAASRVKRGFSPASSHHKAAYRSAEGRSKARRAKRLIYCRCCRFCTCYCLCFSSLYLFFAFLAQKSHVKPRNHLTHSPSTISTWRISYHQTAILVIGIKKKTLGNRRGFRI
jgi:hypothetical protein